MKKPIEPIEPEDDEDDFNPAEFMRAGMEAIDKGGDLNDVFAAMFDPQIVDDARHIPMSEIISSGTNETPGVGHDKCNGIPGYATMLKTKDGRWVCECGGYITKEESIPVLEESVRQLKRMFDELGLKPYNL